MTKVLVIDDEAPIRLLCRVNLEAEQMDVIEAPDGGTVTVGVERKEGSVEISVADEGIGIPQADHQHHLQPGVGHYGVFAGSRWDKEIYPVFRDFIAARSTARTAS